MSPSRGFRSSRFASPGTTNMPRAPSDSKILLVLLLEVLHLRLELGRVGIEDLDLLQRRAAFLLLHLGMIGAQAALVMDELLRVLGEHPGVEELRRVRVLRVLQDSG